MRQRLLYVRNALTSHLYLDVPGGGRARGRRHAAGVVSGVVRQRRREAQHARARWHAPRAAQRRRRAAPPPRHRARHTRQNTTCYYMSIYTGFIKQNFLYKLQNYLF